MYQKTSSLLLSQSQGCSTSTLGTMNRIRPRKASGLSRASSRNGQNSPVFLIQNQGGKSVPDTQPISHRGYW